MTTPATWQTDQACPDCGSPLTLSDDGSCPVRADCGSCGYADTWTVLAPAGGDR
jgi:ribosomal protein S27AE